MFDQTFVGTEKRTSGPWSLAASLTVQSGVVGLLLLVPLLAPEGPFMKIDAPPIIYRANPIVELPKTLTAQRPATTARSVFSSVFHVPTVVPNHIAQINDAPELAASGDGTIPGPPGSIVGDMMAAILPERVQPAPVKPMPVKVEPPPPPAPLRVSTSVQGAKLIFGPKPPYPPLAKAARVQGAVRLTAVIGTDGLIRNLRLLSGPPLLVKAALDAVGAWRYQPTQLNGVPVEVITEVDVNFTLNQ